MIFSLAPVTQGPQPSSSIWELVREAEPGAPPRTSDRLGTCTLSRVPGGESPFSHIILRYFRVKSQRPRQVMGIPGQDGPVDYLDTKPCPEELMI